MARRNQRLPENLAEQVVSDMAARAEEQGTTMTELLSQALATQVGHTATSPSIEWEIPSAE